MTRLVLRGLDKRFGGVHAVDDLDLSVVAGEVRALVGENGSGKSTTIAMVAGTVRADRGVVFVDDEELDPGAVASRHKVGVGTAFQHPRLCPNLTVAENLFAGALPHRNGFVRWSSVVEKAEALLHSIDLDLPVEKPVNRLSTAEQQLLEVARAVALDPKVLNLDETTAALGGRQVDLVFDIVRSRKAVGTSVLFISHRLDEVLTLCDSVTVLRDGRMVDTVATDEVTESDIIRMMVGRELANRTRHCRKESDEPVKLKIQGLRAGGLRQPIDLEVRAGEAVGIAGLVGSGRSTVLEGIFGLLPRSGTVEVDGTVLASSSPRAAVAAGVGLVPEDRQGQALAMAQDVLLNASMVATGRRVRRGIDRDADRSLVTMLFEQVRLKAPGPSADMGTLSGGNQQKVVLGRWLHDQPSVLLLDEPTKGVDVGAKAEIYQLLDKAREDGIALLIVSSELNELRELCDRIVVLREGTVRGTFSNETDEHTLGVAMAGTDPTHLTDHEQPELELRE